MERRRFLRLLGIGTVASVTGAVAVDQLMPPFDAADITWAEIARVETINAHAAAAETFQLMVFRDGKWQPMTWDPAVDGWYFPLEGDFQWTEWIDVDSSGC
jgi:hypothetical protein